jgi:hypothetical protein
VEKQLQDQNNLWLKNNNLQLKSRQPKEMISINLRLKERSQSINHLRKEKKKLKAKNQPLNRLLMLASTLQLVK